MIRDLRQEFDDSKLPIVVGELGRFLPSARYKYANTINGALRRLPQLVDSSACVESTGLTHVGDNTHFNGDSSRELGRRYARAMAQLADI